MTASAGQRAVVEGHVVASGGAHAEAVPVVVDGDARGVASDHAAAEGGLVAGDAARDDEQLGERGAGDEALAAGQLVPVGGGGGFGERIEEVGAVLGDGGGDEDLTGGERG